MNWWIKKWLALSGFQTTRSAVDERWQGTSPNQTESSVAPVYVPPQQSQKKDLNWNYWSYCIHKYNVCSDGAARGRVMGSSSSGHKFAQKIGKDSNERYLSYHVDSQNILFWEYSYRVNNPSSHRFSTKNYSVTYSYSANISWTRIHYLELIWITFWVMLKFECAVNVNQYIWISFSDTTMLSQIVVIFITFDTCRLLIHGVNCSGLLTANTWQWMK